MKAWHIVLVAVFLLAIVYLALPQTREPPKVVEKVVTVEVPVEVVKEVEVVRTEVVEVPVTKEVPVVLTDWESLEELEAFLAADDTDSHIYLKADSEGYIYFTGQCEEAAFQLRDRAMAIGKHLSVVPLHPTEYYKWYGERVKPGHYHTVCSARIGNELYYIEPNTDKHWLAIYLD